MSSNLDNIINKIVEDSKSKISILLEEQEEKIQILKSEFDSKLKFEKENIARKFENTKNLELERIVSKIDLKAKNILLTVKQSLIEETLLDLKNKLENMTENELYDYIISKLSSRENSFENEIIVVNTKYSNLKNRFNNLEVSDDIKNGFIIKYKGIEENYTFDSLIKFKIEEIEQVIQKYFE